ncbi:MAG: RDD family protein [Nonlabens sp.]
MTTTNTAVPTAQNVNIDYNIASVGYRITAFLIDLLIIFIYIIAVEYLGMGFAQIFSDNNAFGLSQLLLLPIFFYSLFFNIIFQGRTPGKFIMKMRLVKVDGSPAAWSDYLVTWVLRLIDIWGTNGGAGIISMIFTAKTQRLGDAAANTIVIDYRKKTKVSHTILEDVEEHYEPQFLNVNLLTDHDINEIKEIYRLAGESRDYATLHLLRNKVAGILNINTEMRDPQFLRTVLKDYSYLTQGR